jgi:S1-C subfamily serine protease
MLMTDRPMRRVTLYSSAGRRPATGPPEPIAPPAAPPVPAIARRPRWSWRPRVGRRRLLALAGAAGLLLLLVTAWHATRPAPPRKLTQADIDAAVLHTLTTKPLPSRAAKAYATVQPSVVRVRGWRTEDGGKHNDGGSSTGSGVVIVDKGIILTNLHVVSGAEWVDVTFADGTESEATVIATRPEQDLAVLQAKTLPDDLTPATLRSTHDLVPGDEVVAVGFPFAIGPSASSGVISGLRREFVSPLGKRLLTNLIQFDAAANPGSSGGPLVTMDGEVIGIVTAILNPTEQRVFVGIGFAVPIEDASSAFGLSPF